MKFKAVLFDLDGTLLNTLGEIAESMNAVLEQHSYQTHSNEAYRYFIGDGVEQLIARALPESERSESYIWELVAEFRAVYKDLWHQSKLYPGIPELLDELVRKGVDIGVCSNKPNDFTKQCVERLLGDWEFAVTVGQSKDIPSKPNPRMVLHAAHVLGLSPDEMVFVGDTNVDMKTAVQAGMYPVGVLWGFRRREELSSAGARKLVQTPGEIVSLF